MIEINHLSKRFGKFKAIDDVTIHVASGTIHGIIGENGAGKTSLIQCLVGVYSVEEGEVLINGESVWENPKVKSQIAYVADCTQFFKGYKVKELVDFYAEIYESFQRSDFEKYNEIFKIPLENKVRQLSKGMQMRLSFMLNLAMHPKVMVLDEPTSGLDAIAKKQLLDLLLGAVAEEGMTVVISSHHLSELEKICDEITILHKGKVTYQTSVEDLKRQVKKLQVVFKDVVPSDLDKWEEIIEVHRLGSVYYLITKEDTPKLEERLRQLGAHLVEEIGLTLEEIFIYTNKERGEKDEGFNTL